MPKRILTIDDSCFMRKVLKNILSDQYEVVEADSGAMGEKLIKEKQPDLILLDIVMPGGEEEGIMVLQKAMKANPKLKIVMLTAVGQDTIMAKCREYGARDYIVKPFDEAEVLSKVQTCLDLDGDG